MLPLALSSTFFILASAAAIAITFAIALWLRSTLSAPNEKMAHLAVCGLAAGNVVFSLVIGAIALSATINIEHLRKPHVDAGCNVASADMTASIDGIVPDSRVETEGLFTLKREENFKLGLSKISDYNDDFRGLIELMMIPAGLAFLIVVRFLFSLREERLRATMPRAAIAIASVASAVIGVTLSHHLLFNIVNGQLSLLGSGLAYCYDYFAEAYSDLFWIIAFSGAVSLIALAVLPEAVRLNYQEKD